MNKTIQKVFIITIAVICCLVAVTLLASKTLGEIQEDGYMVPASASVQQVLSKRSSSSPIELVQVKYSDEILQRADGVYVGENRTKVDTDYPIYSDNGGTIRFFSEDNWLISTDVNLYQTFDGMFVSEGTSFNEDRTQADGDEFILLALPNGLYMNVQHSVLTTRTGSTEIPTNSILNLTEDGIFWFEPDNGTLSYKQETAIFDATLTIGSHTYNYIDLIEALGLVRQAVASDGNKPDEATLEEAKDILTLTETQQGINDEKDSAGAGDSADAGATEQEAEKAGNAGSSDNRHDSDTPVNESKQKQNVSVSFSAVKYLNNSAQKVESGKFQFVLEQQINGEYQIIQRASNKNQNVDFVPVEFKSEGTYTFRMRELESQDSAITSDSTIYRAVVTVTQQQVTDAKTGQTSLELVAKTEYFKNEVSCAASDVKFINETADDQETEGIKPVKVTLVFHKQMNSGADTPSDEKYHFVLRNQEKTAIRYASNEEDTITFSSLNFDEAGIYTYYATEISNPEDTSVIYDSAEFKAEITIEQKDGSLAVAGIKYYKDGNEVTEDDLVFHNRTRSSSDPEPAVITGTPVELTFTATKKIIETVTNKKGDEEIEEKVEKKPENEQFWFALESVNGNSESQIEQVQNKKENIAFSSVTLSNTGVYLYQIREIENTTDKNYSTDASVYTALVTVTKQEGSSALTVATEYFKNGNVCSEDEIIFRNRKLSSSDESNKEGAATAEISLSATKQIDGETYNVESGRFQFLLEELQETKYIPKQWKTNEKDAISFDKLHIKGAGEYNYRITEIDTGDKAYSYDPAIYTVKIVAVESVVDGKTVLKTTKTVQKDGVTVDDGTIVFNNKTITTPIQPDPSGTPQISFTATKIIDNDTTKAVEDGYFHFLLSRTDSEGRSHPVQIKANTGSTVTFDKASFTEPGIYTYTIQELTDDQDESYLYDSSIYKAVITVEKVNSELKANVVYYKNDKYCEAADLVFNNNTPQEKETKKPQAMSADSIAFTTSVQLQNSQGAAQAVPAEYEFTLEKISGGKVSPQQFVNNTASAKDETSGKVAFTPFEIKTAGIYTYQIRQIAGKDTKLKYDTTVFSAQVTVDINGNASVSYYKNGTACNPEEVCFQNREKEILPAEVDIAAGLRLDYETETPKIPESGCFQFVLNQLEKDDSGAVTKTTPLQYKTNYNQTISFDTISLAAKGTYYYQISQLNGGSEMYNYDATVYDVTVVVKQDETTGEFSSKVTYMCDGQRVSSTGVLFYNTTTDAYEEPSTARIYLSATNSVTGLENKEIESNLFHYVLVQELPDSKERILQTKGNVKQNITFDGLEYRNPGTYEYLLYQQLPEDMSNQPYILDQTIYHIKVIAERSAAGEMTARVGIFKGSDTTAIDPKDIVFINAPNPDYEEEESGGGEAEYQVPEVELNSIIPWTYAIAADLSVDDPASTIQRGIKITVFKDLKEKVNSSDIVIKNGLETYPADKYTGTNTLMRTTKYDAETFALSTLQPDSTVYLQVSYKYSSEIKEIPGTVDPTSGTAVLYGGEKYKDEFGKDVIGVDGKPVYDPDTMMYVYSSASTGTKRIDTLDGRKVWDNATQTAYEPYENDDGDVVIKIGGKELPVTVEVEAGTQTPLTQQNRLNYYSSLIKVQLKTIEQGNIQSLIGNWNMEFANSADSLKITNLHLANTSAYDPEAAEDEFDFDNFVLNTLPYAYSMQLILTPEGGSADDALKVELSSTVLQRAQQEDGAVFLSSSPTLDSNKKYNYTVLIQDRYGNPIPLLVGDSQSSVSYENFSGVVYTQKKAPSANIEIVDNAVDKLKLRITVTDTDGALTTGKPLRFTMQANTDLVYSGLAGENWDPTKIAIEPDSDETVLNLLNPSNGSVYEFNLTSLALSRLFTAQVKGDYSPMPDAAPKGAEDPKLEDITDVSLASTPIFTASMSRGTVNFNSSFTDILDTSATINLLMQNTSDTEIMGYVDEYRIYLKDTSGNVICETVLNKQDLKNAEKYVYNSEKKIYLLDAGNALKPAVELYGDASRNQGTAWDSFNFHRTSDASSEEVTYSTPMQLRIKLPEGMLQHNTTYRLEVKAVVIRSHQVYDSIGITLTNTEMTTKKTIPTVLYSDLFIAGDSAEFQTLRIYDPDHTIDDEKVVVYLKRGDTILSVKEATATDDAAAKNEDYSQGISLRFDNLIQGDDYTLQFVALGYNDEQGFGAWTANHIIESKDFVAGSDLTGEVELTSVTRRDTSDSASNVDATLSVIIDDKKGYLGRAGESGTVTMRIWHSESIHYLEYDERLPDRTLTLTAGSGSELIYNGSQVFENLPQNDGYKVQLVASYRGNEVILTELEFTSNPNYAVVNTHAELIAAMKANSSADIVVASDFTQDQNTYVKNFNGSIDFRGHVITKGSNITQYFLYGASSKMVVKNLVYDYPESGYYQNTAAVFYDIAGTVENVIIRTHGQVEISENSRALLAYSVSATGTLKNYIVQLNGDVNMLYEGSSECGVIVSMLRGDMENGYIYGINGAGILGRGVGYASLIGYNRQDSVLHNFYAILDGWFRTGTGNVMLRAFSNGAGDFQNMYIVGDQYSIDRESSKSYLDPLSKLKITNNASSGFKNLWAFSARTYEGANDSVTQIGNMALLLDEEWQESILGGGFDVKGTVPLGFYPRLNLPNSMQKYQEYLPLPTLSADKAPTLLTDNWSTEDAYVSQRTDTSGYITLRFKNTVSGLSIEDVQIEGLETKVMSGKQVDDTFYDVTLKVEVTADASKAAYLSKYKVTGFTYKTGAATRTVECSYTTQNIEFWKTVKDPLEWADINLHMNWNYKLTADLDLSTLSRFQTTISGSTTQDASSSFTGKIDGQEHVLTGISIPAKDSSATSVQAYVFYNIAANAQVKNLFVDGMTLTADATSPDHVGFFRNISEEGIVQNVRIKNSTIVGSGYVGAFVATSAGRVSGCSVMDTTVSDLGTTKAMTIGGFAGQVSGYTEKCYTCNVSVSCVNSNVVTAVGGFTGSNAGGGAVVEDCYSYGSITANASNVGGFYGISPSGDGRTVRRCVSFVNILQMSGNIAGGFAGTYNQTGGNNIVLGDVSGSGAKTNRITGNQSSTGVYCYAGQNVTGKAEDAKGDATALLTGKQLGQRDTWIDTVVLGSNWNYTPVKSGNLPKLSYDASSAAWQQQNIPLPGQASDPTIKVLTAEYSTNYKNYHLTVQLNHPKVTYEQMKALFDAKTLKVELDGFDISDSAVQDKKAEITLSHKDSEDGISYIDLTVSASQLQKALDSYKLAISYTDPNSSRERKLTAMVQFMEGENVKINYREISNINEWINVMAEHGTNGENFLITGEIDFTGQSQNAMYTNLRMNRLEGEGTKGKFTNMQFCSNAAGDPWIEKVSSLISNLTFENCSFDYSFTTTSRSRTAPIYTACSMTDMTFNNLTLKMNAYTRSYFAFVADMDDSCKNITMNHIYVWDGQAKTGSAGNYVGALIGFTRGEVQKVTVTDLKVYAPMSNYVGGIYGGKSNCQGTVGGTVEDQISITGLNITGRSSVGGVTGTSNNLPKNATIEGVTDKTTINSIFPDDDMNVIKATTNGACGVAGGGYSSGGGRLVVEHMNISSVSGYASGAYPTWHATISSALINDCTITGNGHVAGVFAGTGTSSNTSMNFSNIEVLNCTIKNTNATVTTDYAKTTTGGIIGCLNATSSMYLSKVSVRNTTIEGPSCVGGIAGAIVHKPTVTVNISRAYVAEDVTVKATNSIASGMVAYTNRLNMTDSACGATVTAGGGEVGGLVGRVDLVDDLIFTNLKRCYYEGTLTAGTEFAAGLVAKLNSPSVRFTKDNISGCLVAADIRAASQKVSSWALDSSGYDPGVGLVYVYEGTLLNGSKAKDIYDYAELTGTTSSAVPNLPAKADRDKLLVTAQQLSENPANDDQNFYRKTLGFKKEYWNFNSLDLNPQLMPWTTSEDTANGAMLNATSLGGTAGMRVPQDGTVGNSIVVYASGINTINIEGGTPGTETTVGGTEMTFDANGVITVNYDYGSTVSIAGQTVTAATVQRMMMVWGNYWYYADKSGNLHYGNAIANSDFTDKAAELQIAKDDDGNAITVLSSVVHLWHGQALTSDGTIYNLNGGTATVAGSAATPNLQQQTSQPFYSYTNVNGTTVQVYYYFTLAGTTKLQGYRLYEMNGKAYTISMEQSAVYDSTTLVTNTVAGQKYEYFDYLKSDGKLQIYLEKTIISEAANASIAYTSNTAGYSGTVLLLRYADGSMRGIEINTGSIVFEYTPPVTMTAFFARSFRSLFRSSSLSTANSSLTQGQSEQEELEKEYTELLQRTNIPETPIGDSTTGIWQTTGQAVQTTGQGAGQGTNAVAGNGTLASGGTEYEGGGSSYEYNEFSGEAAQDAVSFDSAVNTSTENNAAAAEQQTGTEQGTSETQLSTEAGILSGIQGELSGTQGELSSEEDEASEEGFIENSAESGFGGETASVSVEEYLQSTYGPGMMLYDSASGNYELMTTSSVAEGKPKKLSDAVEELRKKLEEKKDDTAETEEDPKQELSVTPLFNYNIYREEKAGTVSILVIASLSIAALAAIYIIFIRKKKQ